ncbi:MAG: hypothetical protein V1919_03380 [Candidatus Omnitrophota bacterium]
MATKEEVIESFLKCFRISLNYILLYSKEHKSFLKSIADLQENTAALFSYLNPIEIFFTPDSLSIEGEIYSKINLYKELAALFHQRKVQSLRLIPGITEGELGILLDKLALSPKEIIKSGGLSVILSETAENPHFFVTDLDYSQLLCGEGEEIRDIWVFMLRNAVAHGDFRKIEESADNFENIIQKFRVSDLVDDEELKSNLKKFLEYLKNNNREKFLKCNRAILKTTMKNMPAAIDEDRVKELKKFFTELKSEDYSQTLWNEVINDEKFDVSSFNLFSKFLGDQEHREVASCFAKDSLLNETFKNSPSVARRIKKLFSSPGQSLVSDIYRRAILSTGESLALQEAYTFDRGQMLKNYRFILLNLLNDEQNNRRVEIIIDKLFKEWEKIQEENDFEYFRCLCEVIQKRRKENFSHLAFLDLSKKVDNFIESLLWKEALPAEIEDFLAKMKSSSLSAEVYLKKMFEEGKINNRALKAFFNFFPENLPDFQACLKAHQEDIDVLVKVLESLKDIDSPMAFSVLSFIYSFSNDLVKAEIIRIISAASGDNREFIFDVLKGGSEFLKKEALCVLSGQDDSRKALEILFMISNSWGINNKILMENLRIVEELKYKQAVESLEYFYRKTSFWNIYLKRRIKEVIGRLNAGGY